MKAVVGSIQLELSVEEFKQIADAFPSLMNGHANTITKDQDQETKQPQSGYAYAEQKIMTVMKNNPDKKWNRKELATKTGVRENYLSHLLSIMFKQGKIKRIAKGQYSFLNLQEQEAQPSKLTKEEQRFEQLWEKVKAIFSLGKSVSDNQISKLLGIDYKSTIKFLAECCRQNKIEEDITTHGYFKATRIDSIYVENDGEINPSKPRQLVETLTMEQIQELKTRVIRVMQSSSHIAHWTPSKLAAHIGTNHWNHVQKILEELTAEGVILERHGSRSNHNRYWQVEDRDPIAVVQRHG